MFKPKASSSPVEPSEIDQIRKKIDTSFKQFAELVSAARRPLPHKTGDGTYLEFEDDPPEFIKKVDATLKDLSSLGISDVATLLQVQQKQKSGAVWDDKQYLMERLIQTATRFPDNSATGKKITDGFLTGLYNDLQHPPISYLGKEYTYRSADGSFNSLMHPNLGKANTPYARTVAPKQVQPAALPDPGDIFDSVFARKPENVEQHPNKISSVLFYLASIIIHDLFRTDHRNFYNSKTSSYLDLAPLYGSNLQEQMSMRTRKDGKLKPDCFSETRLLSFPPGVGVLLITFNRFHNNVVENLARINQNNQFRRPEGDWPAGNPDDEKYPTDWKSLDENLFQVGRLVTSGLYINIILLDYVRTILNLNKTNDNWALNPRADIPAVPVAAGNQVSAEFNLVYRWHSAISERDDKWTWDFWKREFKGIDPATVDFHTFVGIAEKIEQSLLEADPLARPVRDQDGKIMKRDANGKFDDEELVKILADSIEDCANSYGANRVPTVMRVIEILGIQQARAWSVASLNEFRKYFHLEPHKTFEDINPDPYVAEQLKNLYDHPDYVELYTGLVTESAKIPMVPGAGLTPGYTISRAVLSDAVALVRGDRFYTVDYHPKKLTNWGFSEAASDVSIDNGCVFYKLILNAFPRHFKANSVYAHYPLTIPSEMEHVLDKLGRGPDYDYRRPTLKAELVVVRSHAANRAILSDRVNFKLHASDSYTQLLGKPAADFLTSSDGPNSPKAFKTWDDILYSGDQWRQDVRKFYETITSQLLTEKAYRIGRKNQVDIIRDVGNLAHVHFAAEMWALPLKTAERPLGVFTEHELYLIMLGIYTTATFDVDPTTSYVLQQRTKQATRVLGDLVEVNVKEINAGGVFSRLFSAIFPTSNPLQNYGIKLIQRLLKSGLPPNQLVWGYILNTMGAMTANAAELFSEILEYYLTTGKEHLPAINTLAKDDSDVAFEKLMRYVLEGARLAGETGAYRIVAKDTEIKDGNKTVKVNFGDRVLLNLLAASRDPAVFPNPDKVELNRPLDSYITLGLGPNTGLGDGITRIALTAMFKVVGRLTKLRPAVGAQGEVHKVTAPYPIPEQQPDGPWFHNYLNESHDRLWPAPSSLRINWDD